MKRMQEDLDRGLKRVLEAGGIDRPLLCRGQGYLYVGLDVEHREACDHLYDEFLLQSIESPIPGAYDLIVSMTMLEHVPDNRASMVSMYAALRPGGRMHHYVPSANHPYSLLLRLIPTRVQNILIKQLRPEYAGKTGYAVHFDHCTAQKMRRLLQEVGFSDIDIQTGYRANDYFSFFVPLYILVTAWENLVKWLNWESCASGFVVSARRP